MGIETLDPPRLDEETKSDFELPEEQLEKLSAEARICMTLVHNPELHEYVKDPKEATNKIMEFTGLEHEALVTATRHLTTETKHHPKYAIVDRDSQEGMRLMVTESGMQFLQSEIDKSRQ